MKNWLVPSRRWMIPILFLVLGNVCANNFRLIEKRLDAQDTVGVADLESRLMNGLRARTDEEKAYVKRVVESVNKGELPVKLVDSSYFWVRKNRPDHNFPLFYFKKVLEFRAKAAGIPLNLEKPKD
jgi:hypothetical protein